MVCRAASRFGRTSMNRFSRLKLATNSFDLRKPQAGLDVRPDARGGGGGQRQADRLREALAHLDQLAVFGAEVVAPLGDAVGLVDGQQIDLARWTSRSNRRGVSSVSGAT